MLDAQMREEAGFRFIDKAVAESMRLHTANFPKATSNYWDVKGYIIVQI
jgi:hypothetical protein